MSKIHIMHTIIKRRKKNYYVKEENFVDSSSIGDMAFLLLIFFIVTGSFVLRQGIFFSLPSPNAHSITIEKKQIIEIYPENNGFVYNNSILNYNQLTALLIQQREKHPETVLLIRMKHSVRYERLVDALSAAKETGVARISLKDSNGDN